MLSKCCYRILSFFYLMKFSTDYLTNWYLLTSITQKWLGLIFSLYSIASAREVPFGILQRVQCILQGLTSVHFCTTFIFANSEFGGHTWWLPLHNGNRYIFYRGYCSHLINFMVICHEFHTCYNILYTVPVADCD